MSALPIRRLDDLQKVVAFAKNHEAEFKEDGKRQQKIRIYYNCIGAIDIPKLESKTA